MEKIDPRIIDQNLKRIANQEQISVEAVREEIMKAVSIALKSDDPKAREFWKDLKYDGESPTADEVMEHIIMSLPDES